MTESRSSLPASDFEISGWHGKVAAGWAPADLEAEVRRLVDPASAVATIHWGRNYLYAARFSSPRGPVRVVVKQFRNLGRRRRWERRLRGSKAERSWRVAGTLVEAGLRTPEPLLLIESDEPEGPSCYVARWIDGAAEVRHLFRRVAGDPTAGAFPDVDPEAFLRRLGGFARDIHDAGIWYRDLSMGNVLARQEADGELALYLVDFNRARVGRDLGVWRRTRDICRFPVLERRHREAFLSGYWGEVPPGWSPRWWLYVASVRGYILKHELKNRLRGGSRSRPPSGGRHHAHIPPATPGSSSRDRAVWDPLSDQPHQHAGRLAKAGIRLADAPSHVRDAVVVARALPRAWRRYSELRESLHGAPAPMDGVGLAVRPWAVDPERQAAVISELGVRKVLLRLHPWEDDHEAEANLSAALAEQGVDLAFALPQSRELVRDRGRWRAAVEELGERFAPFGRWFQVGQAINRSKWGVWTRTEYAEMFRDAAAALRRHDGVQLAGPAVIDFEFQFILALVNRRDPDLRFDAVSSLLYVDRRGAPENRQLGFDTVDKVALLRAIAETGRNSTGRCWITEFNWPLWEGPHSPAGRTVAVDEEAQADYLVRYLVLTLGTGLVERAYWWRLLARGYGLTTRDGDGGLRRRPSFHAMRTMLAMLPGAVRIEPPRREGDALLYVFRVGERDVVVGWTRQGAASATLPRPPAEAWGRDGGRLETPPGARVQLTPSPAYFVLEG